MLRRYLFLGLGGAGGFTLRYTWRDIERRLGQAGWTSGMPEGFQFLHIDGTTEPDLGREDGGVLADPPYFLSLNPHRLTYRALDQRVTSSAPARSGLVGWRPDPNRLQVGVDRGLGQIRPVGRIVALANLVHVRNVLDSAITRLEAPLATAQLSELGSPEDPTSPLPPQLVIVSSMGGGAGSGMLLDVCDLLSDMSASDRKWLRSGISVLYTPEATPMIEPEWAPGVAPNALAAMSEMLAAFLHEGEVDRRERGLLEHAGVDPVRINGRRTMPVNLLVGNHNQHLVFNDHYDVYQHIGQAFAAIATSASVQAQLDSFLEQLVGRPPNPTSFAVGRSRDGSPRRGFASALGHARVTLGNEWFLEYAEQRLAAAVTDHLLYAHRCRQKPGDARPEEDAVRERALAVRDGFFSSCGLLERGPELHSVLDAVRPAVHGNLERRVLEGMAVRDGRAEPPLVWLDLVRDLAHRKREELMGEVRLLQQDQFRQWCEVVQLGVASHTLALTAAEGAPVALECLRLLRQELDEAPASLYSEADDLHGRLHRRRERLTEDFSRLRKRRVHADHAKVVEAMRIEARCLEVEAEMSLRHLAAEVIASFGREVLEPFINAFERALRELRYEVDVKAKTSGFGASRSWDEVPKQLLPPLNQMLLRSPASWGERFTNLLHVAVAGADDTAVPRSTTDEQAEAIREVVTGDWLDDPDDEALTIIEHTCVWTPSPVSVRPVGSAPAPASYRITFDPDRLLARSQRWWAERSPAVRAQITESLEAYLAPNEAGLVDPGRLQTFCGAFRAGLQAAGPLVSVGLGALGAVHPGAGITNSYLVDHLPLPVGHPAYALLRHSLVAAGISTNTVDSIFGPGEAPATMLSNSGAIEIVATIDALLHPAAFDSLLALPVQVSRRVRQEPRAWPVFWSKRRTRQLRSFVPVAPEVLHSVCAGWLAARLLNRVLVPARGTAAVEIWHLGRWVRFPYPVLGAPPAAARSPFPAVLESLPLAFIDLVTADADAVLAYDALLALGDDCLFAASDDLTRWILEGDSPDGAPIPSPALAGAPTQPLRDRLAAIAAALAKVQHDCEQLAELEVSDTYTLQPDPAWDLAPSLGDAAAQLLEATSRKVNENVTPG